MASNAIPKELDPLVALAEDAADGAQTHQLAVGLKQNLAVNIRTDLHALMGTPAVPPAPGKQQLWLAAKAAKAAATTAKTVADSNVKAYLAGAVAWLKNHLGPDWSAAWEPLGFTAGSLALPTTPDERLARLPLFVAYFANHPEHALVPPLDDDGNPIPGPAFHAARTQELHTAASDSRAASLQSNVVAGQAKAARDGAVATLRHRLSGLLAELDQQLTDEDPRWYAFGFSRPADPETPQVPELLVLTPGTAGMVLVDWDDARRAERYKVYRQLPGDAEPVLAADNVTESETVLTGLPSGALVSVTVVALNDAGPSQPSAAVTRAVP